MDVNLRFFFSSLRERERERSERAKVKRNKPNDNLLHFFVASKIKKSHFNVTSYEKNKKQTIERKRSKNTRTHQFH